MAEPRKDVPKYKLKIVKDLVELMDSKNTVMIASIKGLPARQFQKIKKDLGKQGVKVLIVKKRALIRALDGVKKAGLKKLKDHAKEDIAILISDMDSFELSTKLSESKSPIKAKAGQEAPEDVKIEAGVTDLPAGPAVSELGSLGLTVKVSDGKIEITEPKVIVKKGGVISEVAAGVMSKLDIMPFSVGFVPEVAFDSKSGQVYTTLILDKEELMGDLKTMFAKSRAFAVSLGHICKETIGLLLMKAASHEKALEKFEATAKEPVNESKGEEKTEETEAIEEKAEEAKENVEVKENE